MSAIRCQDPIFVIGCPRNGKSLVAAILNKHPETLIFFETHIFAGLYRKWHFLHERGGRADAQRMLVEMIAGTQAPYYRAYGVSDKDVLECLRQGPPGWVPSMDRYTQLLMRAKGPRARRWGEKTPSQIGYAGMIRALYPKAQFVYVYRDPRDVVAAMSRKDYTAASNGFLLNAEVARLYIDAYERDRKRIDPANLYEMRYEDLVAAPEKECRKLCDFLHLDYAPALLEEADAGLQKLIGWENHSFWGKVSPQEAATDRQMIAAVEAHLGPQIRRQGYALAPGLRFFTRCGAWLQLLPFKAFRAVTFMFWALRYPGTPYIPHDFPSVRTFKHWTTQWRGAK